ncbi:MAG: ethylbenzene dehydrogenase [Deinococcus sp.]|nr:ethylbenzene dehydrogenase [Deinococcus sp.]
MTTLLRIVLFTALAVLALVPVSAAPSAPDPQTLLAIRTDTPPTLDGQVEALWDQASVLTVPVSGGANAGHHTVTLQALYTADRLYILARWDDPTLSDRRFPWVKQQDGTWIKLQTNTQGDENVYYEDKFSIIWDINITGFQTAGCFTTCHAGEPNKPYGNKYTPNEGELGDIWHWKLARTGPVDQADDQYVNADRWVPDRPEAGRHSDPKESGGYTDNSNAEKTAPAFTSPTQPAPPYSILDAEKVPFADTYAPGDEIAGIIVATIVGDRGDVSGVDLYQDGMWTLEMSRALVTGSQFDVQWDDLGKTYYFGPAVFDNAQVRHSFAFQAYKLVFAQ